MALFAIEINEEVFRFDSDDGENSFVCWVPV